MASLFTHAFSGVMIGAMARPGEGARFATWMALCAVLPDLDVLAFPLGIPYGSPLGHRGFTHSLLFAGVAGVLVARLAFAARWRVLALPLCLSIACHGLLDGMTDGGLGVGYFIPFDWERYFLPWRPLMVSPIGIERFFSPWGLQVLLSEWLWIWLPVILLWVLVRWRDRGRLSGVNQKIDR